MTALTAASPRTALLRRLFRRDVLMVWIALAALLLLCAILEPGTVGSSALLSMLPFAAVLAIASVGQCLTIQTGGIDLSVPGSMTLAAAIVTVHAGGDNGRLAISVLLAVGACLVGGLVNGLVITKLRIAPIVATLAVNALLVGVIQTYSNGTLVPSPTSLSRFTFEKTFGIPNTVLIAAVFVIGIWLLMSKTIVGRRMVAIGANPIAARASGLRVTRYLVGAYVAAACCFATAGVVLTGYLQTPDSRIGDPYLFSSVTAVVIGGTAFRGGRGRIVGTAVGAVFISQLNVFLTATGAPASTTYIVQALAIAVAATLNSPEAAERIRQLLWRRGGLFGRHRAALTTPASS